MRQKPGSGGAGEQQWAVLSGVGLVPDVLFLIVHQEEPAELDRQGAAVGDGDVADDLCVVQDAAKVHIHALKDEVGVAHFPAQTHAVHLGML